MTGCHLGEAQGSDKSVRHFSTNKIQAPPTQPGPESTPPLSRRAGRAAPRLCQAQTKPGLELWSAVKSSNSAQLCSLLIDIFGSHRSNPDSPRPSSPPPATHTKLGALAFLDAGQQEQRRDGQHCGDGSTDACRWNGAAPVVLMHRPRRGKGQRTQAGFLEVERAGFVCVKFPTIWRSGSGVFKRLIRWKRTSSNLRSLHLPSRADLRYTNHRSTRSV